MALPQPDVSLTGSCSVVFDNVLYTYSGSAFQSLSLEEGAEWKTLPNGESVEGGVCVGSTPGDPSVAALFIVGGKSASPDYTGLQRFTYAAGNWETVQLTDSVLKDRVQHSATFLTASDSILVYSGDQDGGTGPSSQTFTIQASEPHGVQAYQSTISPPGVAPLLLPWSATQAVMVSGNPTNVNVMLFDTAASWVDSGTTLAAPLWQNGATPKAALATGDDGSKHLYTFDLSGSPNRVDRIVLAGAGGAPVTASAPVKARAMTVKRRQLVNTWPDYNSTLAPTTTRDGFSVASDSTGLMVISGGNDQDPLTVFNGKENQWVDTNAMLVPEQSVLSAGSSTSSSATSSETSSATSSISASATSSTTSSVLSTSSASVSTTSSIASSASSGAVTPAETAASSATASPVASQGMPPTVILGIVLGVIFGIAFLLVILLFCINKSRQRKNAAAAGTTQGPNGMVDEKAPVRDLPQGPSPPFMPGHAHQGSHGSFSSMAILMGGAQKPGIKRNQSNGTKRSSVSSIFNKEFKSTIGRPQYNEEPEPDFVPRSKNLPPAGNAPKRPPRASDNQDGLRRSSGWNRYWSGGSMNLLGLGGSGNNTQRQTLASETSHYSNDNIANRMTADSATVPPLHVETRFELNRVNSGSPTVSQYNPHIREGQSGQIERPVSSTSSAAYSSGIPESVEDNWDPTMAKKPWGSDRAPSSHYSQSTINFVAGLGAPSSNNNNNGRAPAAMSRQPQLNKAAVSSDMSWLNLGDSKP